MNGKLKTANVLPCDKVTFLQSPICASFMMLSIAIKEDLLDLLLYDNPHNVKGYYVGNSNDLKSLRHQAFCYLKRRSLTLRNKNLKVLELIIEGKHPAFLDKFFFKSREHYVTKFYSCNCGRTQQMVGNEDGNWVQTQ